MSKSRPFYAKYAGTPCLTCNQKVQIGHLVILEELEGKKVIYHHDCQYPTGTRHLKPYVHVGGGKPNTYRRKIKRK